MQGEAQGGARYNRLAWLAATPALGAASAATFLGAKAAQVALAAGECAPAYLMP